MKLYHGSNVEISAVDLSKGNKFKDFGRGFYTTHIRQQAVLWSQRIADRFGGTAVVSEFEFDMEQAVAAGLKVKVFEEPDKEWALFVMANRKQGAEEYKHEYDIVVGPVADDRMAQLFGLFEMDIIDLDAVVAGLIYKGLNSQYFFATERALNFLKRVL